MNTPLYAVKFNITAFTVFPALVRGPSALVEYADATFTVQFADDTKRERLFELMADLTREVGNIYRSMIDGKEYVEWYIDKSSIRDGMVIIPQGFIFALNELPPEEFGND